jgi:hypothetical protein
VDIEARFEFRIWSQTLQEVKTRLLRLATPVGTEVSEEIYLVSTATYKCNVKIRNEMIDIKYLISVEDGLERWTPILKVSFPLKASILASDIFPALEVQSPLMSKEQYGKVELLDEIISPQRKIAIVLVSKTRLRFALKTCEAEFASTVINEVLQDTVAVEDSDPHAVRQVIREIGIDDVENVNYIRQIKHILGW